MELKLRILLGILIAGILLIAGWNFIWTPVNKGYCKSDGDCKFTCGCGCIPKNKVCPIRVFCRPTICGSACRCENGECKSWADVYKKAFNTKNIELCKEIRDLSCREFCLEMVREKLVTITTDKTEYTKGETIKIILRNNLDRPIWYYDWSEFGCVGGFSIGKKEERYKEFYPLATEKCLRPIAKLEPKSEKVYKLNLSLFTPAREHWEKYNVKLLGTFKLKFNYFLNEISAREYHINKAITIYSNEFTIK